MTGGTPWEDHYARQARREKWLARSVYKLQEIDGRFHILHKGYKVLDLGCYPGSWSQYCLKKVGMRGEVLGLDLKRPDRLSAPNFRFINADVLELDLEWLRQEVGPRDAVLSDMAPSTTGVGVADVSRSLELARKALAIAGAVLKPGGHCLSKVFEGEGINDLRGEFSQRFDLVRTVRPSAVRKASREVYLLGLRMCMGERM